MKKLAAVLATVALSVCAVGVTAGPADAAKPRSSWGCPPATC